MTVLTILTLLAAIAVNVVLLHRWQSQFAAGFIAGWDAATSCITEPEPEPAIELITNEAAV